MIALHQPGSDDADHTVMPVALREKKKWGNAVGLLRFQQRDGFSFDGITEFPSLAVVVIAAASESHGLTWI